MKRLPLCILATLSLFIAGSLSLIAGQLSVLSTGDMHGWLEPQSIDGRIAGGAAESLAYWKKVEGYEPGSGKFLLISSGDIATGPAISTVFKGEPVVNVMNLMGYEVSALGNHEFDFRNLDSLCKQAKFPIIAANIANADGTPSKLIQGTAIIEKAGVKVGVVGLIVKEFPAMSGASGLVGLPYEEALRKAVPELRAQGAKLIIVAAHVPQGDLCKLAGKVQDLKIALMLGGHSHELAQQKIGNVWIVSSGDWWRAYSRIDIDIDDASGKVSVLSSKQAMLLQEPAAALADPAVKAEVAKWRQALETSHGEVLGYTEKGLAQGGGVPNMILAAWLASCQPADIAMSNLGGFRQALAPGEIRKFDLIGVMPFDNSLLRLKMTGAQLQNYLHHQPSGEKIAFCGAKLKDGSLVLAKTGTTLEPDAVYSVLTNSFLYSVSSSLKAADPTPETASKDWRTPVIEWLKSNPSSQAKPLESLVDAGAK